MNRRAFLSLALIAPFARAIRPVEQLNVPITWSRWDMPTPLPLSFTKLIDNSIAAHDQMIEEAIFRGTRA